MKVPILQEKFRIKFGKHKKPTKRIKPEDYVKRVKKNELRYNNKAFFNDMKSLIYAKIKSVGGINPRNATIYHRKKLKSSDSKVNEIHVIFRSGKKKFNYLIYPKLVADEVKFVIRWHNGKTKSEFKVYNTWTLNTPEGTAITFVRILKSKQ